MKHVCLCRANSALPHAHVEREAQAARSSAKRGQHTTLLGPLRQTGGTVSERCYICRRAAVWPDARWVGHDEADAGLRVHARSPLTFFVFMRSLVFFILYNSSKQYQFYQVLQSTSVVRTQQVVLAAILSNSV